MRRGGAAGDGFPRVELEQDGLRWGAGRGPWWRLGGQAKMSEDLAGDDWCVQGEFQIYLEPLSCVDPLAGQDCFPAVVVDATSDTDPGAHCALVNTMGTFERTCAAARSTDGRYFDFALRPELQCDTVNCSTAVTPTNWTLLKSLYRPR